MDLKLSAIFYLYKVFLENYESDNCAKVLEEEFYMVIYGNSLNDKHDYNVITMSSMNINDANNIQSYKLGDAMFDEDDLFSPPTYDDKIYYDDSMPPIYDDYCDDTYAIINSDNHTCETCHNYKYPLTEHYSFNEELIFSVHVLYDTPTITNDKKFAYGDTNKKFMHVDHEKNTLRDSYIVEFIHDATENYYERGRHPYRYLNNTKFSLFMLKVLKLHLLCLPVLVDSCSNKLIAYKIPMYRKWVRFKYIFYITLDALFVLQFLSFM